MANYAPDTESSAADDWRHQALCRKAKRPDVMYPDPTDAVRLRTAKQWCSRCPVMSQCAGWALDNREQFGVWGGLSEAERRQMLRHRAEQKLKPEPVVEAAPVPVPEPEPAPAPTLGVRCDLTELDTAMCAHCHPATTVERPKPAKQKKPPKRESATCPSRAMYRKHRQRGEDCEPCRIANNQADRRLRNTGTSKVLA